MREWQRKLQTGEYISEWRGFSPYWMGCFYGDSVMLGGEEEFSHCYDFFSGVGDVDWWIVSEIDKLTDEQKERMYSIMVRNKELDDMLRNRIDVLKKICEDLNIDSCYVYRLGNKLRKELVESENPTDQYKKFLKDGNILKRLSFDTKTRERLLGIHTPTESKEKIGVWYMYNSQPKMMIVDSKYKSKIIEEGYDDDLPTYYQLMDLLNEEI